MIYFNLQQSENKSTVNKVTKHHLVSGFIIIVKL